MVKAKEAQCLLARCALTSKEVYLGLTKFVDDLAAKYFCRPSGPTMATPVSW